MTEGISKRVRRSMGGLLPAHGSPIPSSMMNEEADTVCGSAVDNSQDKPKRRHLREEANDMLQNDGQQRPGTPKTISAGKAQKVPRRHSFTELLPSRGARTPRRCRPKLQQCSPNTAQSSSSPVLREPSDPIANTAKTKRSSSMSRIPGLGELESSKKESSRRRLRSRRSSGNLSLVSSDKGVGEDRQEKPKKSRTATARTKPRKQSSTSKLMPTGGKEGEPKKAPVRRRRSTSALMTSDMVDDDTHTKQGADINLEYDAPLLIGKSASSARGSKTVVASTKTREKVSSSSRKKGALTAGSTLSTDVAADCAKKKKKTIRRNRSSSKLMGSSSEKNASMGSRKGMGSSSEKSHTASSRVRTVLDSSSEKSHSSSARARTAVRSDKPHEESSTSSRAKRIAETKKTARKQHSGPFADARLEDRERDLSSSPHSVIAEAVETMNAHQYECIKCPVSVDGKVIIPAGAAQQMEADGMHAFIFLPKKPAAQSAADLKGTRLEKFQPKSDNVIFNSDCVVAKDTRTEHQMPAAATSSPINILPSMSEQLDRWCSETKSTVVVKDADNSGRRRHRRRGSAPGNLFETERGRLTYIEDAVPSSRRRCRSASRDALPIRPDKAPEALPETVRPIDTPVRADAPRKPVRRRRKSTGSLSSSLTSFFTEEESPVAPLAQVKSSPGQKERKQVPRRRRSMTGGGLEGIKEPEKTSGRRSKSKTKRLTAEKTKTTKSARRKSIGLDSLGSLSTDRLDPSLWNNNLPDLITETESKTPSKVSSLHNSWPRRCKSNRNDISVFDVLKCNHSWPSTKATVSRVKTSSRMRSAVAEDNASCGTRSSILGDGNKDGNGRRMRAIGSTKPKNIRPTSKQTLNLNDLLSPHSKGSKDSKTGMTVGLSYRRRLSGSHTDLTSCDSFSSVSFSTMSSIKSLVSDRWNANG